MTHVVKPNIFFKWQGGYGAFTVSKDGLALVKAYIMNQRAHHAEGRIFGEWEITESDDKQ
jgi:hypothetical protein